MTPTVSPAQCTRGTAGATCMRFLTAAAPALGVCKPIATGQIAAMEEAAPTAAAAPCGRRRDYSPPVTTCQLTAPWNSRSILKPSWTRIIFTPPAKTSRGGPAKSPEGRWGTCVTTRGRSRSTIARRKQKNPYRVQAGDRGGRVVPRRNPRHRACDSVSARRAWCCRFTAQTTLLTTAKAGRLCLRARYRRATRSHRSRRHSPDPPPLGPPPSHHAPLRRLLTEFPVPRVRPSFRLLPAPRRALEPRTQA